MTKTVFRTEGRELQQHLLVIPARDKDAADKLTLTLHGPQTPDRDRLVRVLAHLLGSDAEWDSERPNCSFIVSMDA